MQLIVVSAVWSWLPSYLNRFYGVTPEAAATQAALVVLAGRGGLHRLGLSWWTG